jgi:hypothetical protein
VDLTKMIAELHADRVAIDEAILVVGRLAAGQLVTTSTHHSRPTSSPLVQKKRRTLVRRGRRGQGDK